MNPESQDELGDDVLDTMSYPWTGYAVSLFFQRRMILHRRFEAIHLTRIDTPVDAVASVMSECVDNVPLHIPQIVDGGTKGLGLNGRSLPAQSRVEVEPDTLNVKKKWFKWRGQYRRRRRSSRKR